MLLLAYSNRAWIESNASPSAHYIPWSRFLADSLRIAKSLSKGFSVFCALVTASGVVYLWISSKKNFRSSGFTKGVMPSRCQQKLEIDSVQHTMAQVRYPALLAAAEASHHVLDNCRDGFPSAV